MNFDFDTATVKAGQSLATIHNVCQVFEEQNHNFPSIEKDFRLNFKIIMDKNVSELKLKEKLGCL